MYLYLYIGIYFPSCTYTRDIHCVPRSASKRVPGVKNGDQILCTFQDVVHWTWHRWKLCRGARVSSLRKSVCSVCKVIVFPIFSYTNRDPFLLGLLLPSVMSTLVEDPILQADSSVLEHWTPLTYSWGSLWSHSLIYYFFKWVSKSWCCLCCLERCCFQIRDLCRFSLNLRNKR